MNRLYCQQIRLLIIVFASAPTMLFAPLATAQEGAVEEVIVTGSRIGRASDFESPSPITTVDREFIENSGYLNLQRRAATTRIRRRTAPRPLVCAGSVPTRHSF